MIQSSTLKSNIVAATTEAKILTLINGALHFLNRFFKHDDADAAEENADEVSGRARAVLVSQLILFWVFLGCCLVLLGLLLFLLVRATESWLGGFYCMFPVLVARFVDWIRPNSATGAVFSLAPVRVQFYFFTLPHVSFLGDLAQSSWHIEKKKAPALNIVRTTKCSSATKNALRVILKNTFAPGDLDTVINQLVFQSQGNLGQFVDNRDLFFFFFFVASAFRPVWPGRCDLSFICIPQSTRALDQGGVEPRQAVSPKALRPWTIPLRYSVGSIIVIYSSVWWKR